MREKMLRAGALGALAWTLAGAAQALQISSLSPQGEVAQVRRVVVKFDQAAVRFGDPQAPEPLALSCSDAQASRGSARWNNEREWVLEFDQDLPPGIRCTLQVKPGFRSPQGEQLAPRQWRFHTGGPFVQRAWPAGGHIDEQQFFVLRLNGPASLDSLRQHVACQVQGLGERVPVRLVEGGERAQLLAALRLEQAAAREPLRYATLACNRTLPPEARVQLVFGRGVATPSGVANSVERRFSYQVRPPFAASFSCERENAQAACLPIRPLTLSFNAPVTRQLAGQVRLVTGQGSVAPRLEPAGADPQSVVNALSFPPPFAEGQSLRIELPADFQDASGRRLANADSFPLAVPMAPLPPLAKFAAAPFGILERYAEPDGQALLPVTLRKVEAELPAQALAAGQLGTLAARSDAEIVRWLLKVARYEESFHVDRAQAQKDSRRPLPAPLDAHEKERVQARMVSLLEGTPGVRRLQLPRPQQPGPRPFEVVGIPLAPGFHVVEIASPVLGQSLLDPRHGERRTMYVRTTALVTNLAVHFKLGRENALAWVTTLDKGQVVAGAQVRVSSCDGREHASAVTNAQGIAELRGLDPQAPPCREGEDESGRRAWFVSARAPDGRGGEDLAFTFSDWQRGIEPWRFNVPTSEDTQPDRQYHTVLDRPLLRAGETVSMKHFARTLTLQGFGLPERLPDQLVIRHLGSGQEFSQPLRWRKTASGGLSAESEFKLPPAARLGVYDISLRGNDEYASGGSFRVEEFRLPVFEGRIAPAGDAPLVSPGELVAGVQVNYVSGGAAAQLPVRVSALVRRKPLAFADHEDFSFAPPRGEQAASGDEDDDEEQGSGGDSAQRLVADKLPLTLDGNGAGQLTIRGLPQSPEPQELVLEASYADPNGELQTLRHVSPLWPAAVLAGLRAEGWVAAGRKIRFQALALDLSGRPAAGVPLEVRAAARITTTSRKRMVGGFYSYDNRTERKDLGRLCSGRSDSRGLLLCEATLAEAGEVELVATASDPQGRQARAASTVWVTRQGELWFGGADHDRIDVLPERRDYQPGETARLQVRMPFRHATALVAVEREGILQTRVVQLRGDDPTVELKIEPGWGPNVYVSVLALRGRLREVPWYSFFTWGFKAPREWWSAFRDEGREYVAPTALVDLSRPAYRLGMAELRVGARAHQLAVRVQTDQPSYPVRGQAKVSIQVQRPDGQPAAHGEVALAAVDQALLELLPNTSWRLLEAMLQRRSWGVATATAQMEIIGRRHYGRKAVPAGGGGGQGATRELLDTLLLWNPRLQLDAQGRAELLVPLNDSLTSFRIVAVADHGSNLFGTGEASIRVTQDLQIISGLPPLVREGDQFRAQLTLRNTTARAMQVEVLPRATLLTLEPQQLELPAGAAREVAWNVTAPAGLAQTRAGAVLWEVQARDTVSGARDAIKLQQRILPAVPLSVQQASLVQLEAPWQLEVAPPADALPATGARRGGLRLALQPRLAEGLPGIRDWFANYPFSCLEQQASKAIGLRDARLWQSVVAQLPTYLDGDGLAYYFPPRAGQANRGSDTLSAYLLAAAHEAASLAPEFALPDEARAPLERGLIAFVEGRIQRDFWSPRRDLEVRKLAALEALSRYGKVQPRMLTGITIAPSQWPTHAVIDWLNILRRVPSIPQREERLREANQVLQARLSWQGSRLGFSSEREDHWWWLMAGGDTNAARLLLAVLDDPGWQPDLGRLVAGLIGRQQQGAWQTTTANLWGGLALEQFSRRFESTPVAGVTRATLGAAQASVDWSKVERVQSTDAQGAPHQGTQFGAPAAAGMLRNNTMQLPWPAGAGTLAVEHQGSGKPWLTLQSLAAIELRAPYAAGFQLKKTVTPVEQAVSGRYSRGDVLRVALEVVAASDMTWVVVSDPLPGGATLLGSGLGRDSQIAASGQRAASGAWPAFEERSFEAYRAYYEYVPKGSFRMEYTVRLNNVGDFALPPTRVEAMYAPEMFGVLPNARVQVEAGR